MHTITNIQKDCVPGIWYDYAKLVDPIKRAYGIDVYKDLLFDLIVKEWDPAFDKFHFHRITNAKRDFTGDVYHFYWECDRQLHETSSKRVFVEAFMLHPDWAGVRAEACAERIKNTK